MQKHSYDIIIVGAGCAGMQLLFALLHHPAYQQQTILLLDDVAQDMVEKTWCFWVPQLPHPYEAIISKKWADITIGTQQGSKTETIHPYQYCHIASKDFFTFHHGLITQHSCTNFQLEKVEHISKTNDGFSVSTTQHTYYAKQVYTSATPKLAKHSPNEVFLHQQFFGWQIETELPNFNVEAATMMDFNVHQHTSVNFAYVLPFSPKNALVEITSFCQQKYHANTLKQSLENYLAATINGPFTVQKVEEAAIPMTSHPFNRYSPEGAINIGTAAGKIKPTTGYAFHRIFKDSALLADCFFNGVQPPALVHNRFFMYDSLLLKLLLQKPASAKAVLQQLFQRVPYATILRFLDEDTDLWNEAKIFLQLPKKDLVKLFIQQGISW